MSAPASKRASSISSAKGILALLRETDTAILRFALHRLHDVVDSFWFEISSDIALIEELHECASLTEDLRQLAALIAAKVFFHLNEYSESVNFALAAGPLFDVNKRSLFTDTILSRCIDLYVASRDGSNSLLPGGAVEVLSDKAEVAPLDPRLDALFSTLAHKWQAEDDTQINVKELIGFAVRARRLDLLDIILRKHIEATNSAEMLTFTFHVANVLVTHYNFRRDILQILAGLYTEGLQTIDYFSLAQCLVFLGDAARMAEVVHTLIHKKGEKILAYQLALDLFDFSNQEFIGSVTKELERLDQQDTTSTSASPSSAAAVQALSIDDIGKKQLLSALHGEVTTSLYVKFLYARCLTDVHIINNIKKGIDPRNSITHNATIIANALMNCGTTIDGFLRDNMDWLARAQQWAKFTATATVGVLHKGHTAEAMNVLKTFLPDGSVGPLPFQEAGAMYGLGLIHGPVGATSSSKVIEYLRNALRQYSSSEQIVHGASLGIGLAAMGLHDEDIFDALFTCVSGCDAVAGEGAAVGIGLVMLGSGNERVVESMKRHAMEFDQKEKTVRGLAMSMALVMLGREDESQPLVDELLAHPDPWVRLGGVFTIGLAFSGTSNAKAIERLLAIAVRDVSDDVRRNAVMMIGFLTFKDPQLCIDMTKVLVDSYNPHIRYGVAMAVAIAASGTAHSTAVEMLWTLKDDLVDFVRQGAFIGLALVLVQASEKAEPKVKDLRQLLAKKITDRREDTCTKFGCILATGLLDAGGRNCTILLHKQRHRLAKSVVGMFVFSQYWYWFPYTLMISLAIHPTCFIGLNENFDMPKYTFVSDAPPSNFAMPKSVQQEKKEAKASAQQKKVILSTTRKEEEVREKKKRGGSTTLGQAEDSKTSPTAAGAPADFTSAEEDKKDDAATEPNSEVLENPARVTMAQFPAIKHETDGRYRPLKPSAFGVCMLTDLNGGSVELVEIDPSKKDDTAPVPEAFTWP